MRLLISGFEPFGGAAVNPSALVAQAVAAALARTAEAQAIVLPVVYARAWPMLLAAIEHHRPDLVLATGLAGGRAGLSVERLAVNLDDGEQADNAGVSRTDKPITPDGPLAYQATVPVRRMVEAAVAAGVPAQSSLSAGSFLCNHVFFRLCHEATARGGAWRSGFIHLPWLPEQAAADPPSQPHLMQPYLSLAQMRDGLIAALRAVD